MERPKKAAVLAMITGPVLAQRVYRKIPTNTVLLQPGKAQLKTCEFSSKMNSFDKQNRPIHEKNDVGLGGAKSEPRAGRQIISDCSTEGLITATKNPAKSRVFDIVLERLVAATRVCWSRTNVSFDGHNLNRFVDRIGINGHRLRDCT